MTFCEETFDDNWSVSERVDEDVFGCSVEPVMLVVGDTREGDTPDGPNEPRVRDAVAEAVNAALGCVRDEPEDDGVCSELIAVVLVLICGNVEVNSAPVALSKGGECVVELESTVS